MSPIDASKVKARRHKLGLTQQELAGKIGVARPRITELETGKPVTMTVETLERLARALGVSPGWLLRK